MDERSNSVAVTASELAKAQPVTWESDHFSSSGVSIDFARIAEKSRAQSYHTFILRQTSYNTQSLISTGASDSSSYSIKHYTRSGFTRNRPQTVIRRDRGSGNQNVAEVWAEAHGEGSKIVYTATGVTQHLIREAPGQRRFTCSMNEDTYTWQPLGPSKNVLELVNKAGGRAGLFVYAEIVCQRSASYSGGPLQERGVEIGRLHVMDYILHEQGILEQVCCTAVVVLEKLKKKLVISGFSS